MAERSGATRITTSSMCMEVKAITEALTWLKDNNYHSAIFVTDSMSTLEKVKKEMLYADWSQLIAGGGLTRIKWIFCPGHAGVRGNERADRLAGQATIKEGELTLDPHCVGGRPGDGSEAMRLRRFLYSSNSAGEGYSARCWQNQRSSGTSSQNHQSAYGWNHK